MRNGAKISTVADISKENRALNHELDALAGFLAENYQGLFMSMTAQGMSPVDIAIKMLSQFTIELGEMRDAESKTEAQAQTEAVSEREVS
ncbi:MAG: hypothetical protein ACR2QF_04880 [Geminicoccaceae bacterium]